MKSNIKKGVLSLGTIAAVAAPIAAVISCGSTQNTINWKDTDTFGGVDGKQFLQEIKHLGKAKQNAITVGRQQMMQLQYESESIRSLSAQVEDFRYENWQTEMDNKKLTEDKADVSADIAANPDVDQDTKDGYQTKLDTIEKSMKENTDKITEVDKKITKITDVLSKLDLTAEFLEDSKDEDVANFYKNDYSASDYPKVYKPLSVIRTEKTDIVNDAYRTFYPQFTTREDGDKEWPSELAKNYGDAATFSQAIDYLVTQDISAKAFNSYKFEINKSFTVQQKLWAQYIDKNAYKFLIANPGNNVAGSQSDPEIADDIKSIVGDTSDTSKIAANIEANILKINKGDVIDTDKTVKASTLSSSEIFLGSKSPDHRLPENAINQLGQVVKYQHMLIKATQGKSPSEAWTITADDLKKLMEFDQYEDSGVQITQGVDFIDNAKLFADTAGDDRNKFTDFVLGAISGNSAGTIKTQGSLGIKSEIEYLKSMVPGFSLGALAITEGTSNVIADGVTGTDDAAIEKGTKLPTLDLKDLIANLKTELQKEVKNTYPSTDVKTAPDAEHIDEINNDIDATLTTLGDDKVKTIFGKVFEEFFADKKQLVYKVTGTNNYLVISQFGIHIIKRTSYATAADITAALDADMADMAKDSSLASSTSLVDELNSAFTDTKIMEVLLGSTPVDSTTGYVGALNKKLEEYNKGKTEEVDRVTTKDIKDVIDSVNKLKSKTDVDGAIGDKLENWLVTQIDSDLRDIGTLKLSDIYGWVKASEQAATKGIK